MFGDSKLTYYKSQEEYLDRKIMGDIELKHIIQVKRIDPEFCDGRNFGFSITSDKPHFFAAASVRYFFERFSNNKLNLLLRITSLLSGSACCLSALPLRSNEPPRARSYHPMHSR